MTEQNWNTMPPKAPGHPWSASSSTSMLATDSLQLDEDLVKQQQAAYSVSGVDEEASRVIFRF